MGATGEGENHKEHPEWHPSPLGGACTKHQEGTLRHSHSVPRALLYDMLWSSSFGCGTLEVSQTHLDFSPTMSVLSSGFPTCNEVTVATS